MENNKPSWHDAAYKLSQENNKEIEDYIPVGTTRLEEFEPETFEKYKDLIAEFETRARNSFAHLASIYHDKEIVINVLSAYRDSFSKSNILLEIAQHNAALYIELRGILLMVYFEARNNIGKNYENYNFI